LGAHQSGKALKGLKEIKELKGPKGFKGILAEMEEGASVGMRPLGGRRRGGNGDG